MFWFVPNYPAVYQASIDFPCGGTGAARTNTGAPYIVPPYSHSEGGSAQLMAGADVLNIPMLHLAFDRELLNEQYRDFHKDGATSTTTGGAAVLKQQIDYTAAAERAYRLRHATVVRCIMHHSIRREAHGHDVGVFQRTLMMVQDNLKASAPPGSSVEGGNPLGPSGATGSSSQAPLTVEQLIQSALSAITGSNFHMPHMAIGPSQQDAVSILVDSGFWTEVSAVRAINAAVAGHRDTAINYLRNSIESN